MNRLSNSALRKELHLSGCEFMRKGNFLDAMIHFKRTYDECQGHILLILDLASCYYMLNDFANYQKWTLHGLEEFNQNKMLFSHKTKAHSTLALGKLLEELGSVNEALDLYSLFGKEYSANHFEQDVTNLLIQIEAQHLRLLTELNLIDRMQGLYVRCEQYKSHDIQTQYNLQISLLIADFHLTDREASLKRLDRILNHPGHPEYDRRLAFFNFIFEALKSRMFLHAEILRTAESFDYFQLDSFEQTLVDFLRFEFGLETLKPLDCFRSESLSFMCSVRYLLLISQREKLAAHREASKKLSLYLKSIQSGSRRVLEKQWNIQPKALVNVTLTEKSAMIDGLEIVLPDRIDRLLKMLATENQVSCDRLILSLFGLDLSESSRNRLRVLVQRANLTLAPRTGIKNSFMLTKSHLSLHPSLQVSF